MTRIPVRRRRFTQMLLSALLVWMVYRVYRASVASETAATQNSNDICSTGRSCQNWTRRDHVPADRSSFHHRQILDDVEQVGIGGSDAPVSSSSEGPGEDGNRKESHVLTFKSTVRPTTASDNTPKWSNMTEGSSTRTTVARLSFAWSPVYSLRERNSTCSATPHISNFVLRSSTPFCRRSK